MTFELTATAQGQADGDDFSFVCNISFTRAMIRKTVTFTAEGDDAHFEAGERLRLSVSVLPDGFEADSAGEAVVTIEDTNDPMTEDLDALDVVWNSPNADA